MLRGNPVTWPYCKSGSKTRLQYRVFPYTHTHICVITLRVRSPNWNVVMGGNLCCSNRCVGCAGRSGLKGLHRMVAAARATVGGTQNVEKGLNNAAERCGKAAKGPGNTAKKHQNVVDRRWMELEVWRIRKVDRCSKCQVGDWTAAVLVCIILYY